jgi:hypothetical protein
VPMPGKGSPPEPKFVTQMLNAAQKQVDTGVPALRGELDFAVIPKIKTGRPKYHPSKL